MDEDFSSALAQLKDLRRIERRGRREKKRLREADMTDPRNLLTYLKSFIPPRLLPGNVGTWEDIFWDFSYTLDFDFGENPSWSNLNTAQKFSFLNSEEAVFLITDISVKWPDNSQGMTAGQSLPMELQLQDGQSSRIYQSEPIALQGIGDFGNPTPLDFPIVLVPSGRIDAIVGLAPEQLELPDGSFTGPSNFSLIFHGLKTRWDTPVRAFMEKWM